MKALEQEKYVTPTPIQEQAIPAILQKRDLLGCAQTGTGKTAAFVIPLLQLMQEQQPYADGRKVRALILSPTRELALQIGDSVRAYGQFLNFKHAVVYGGVSQHTQVQAIRQGVDIIVATPGRLLDLVGQRHLSLSSIQYFVLDEADRMLDMGFVNDVKKIIGRLPLKRQTLLFSATMPAAIMQLANSLLTNPAKVEVTPVSSTVDIIDQRVYYTEKQNKQALLIHLLQSPDIESVLVFTEMKHLADRLARDLNRAGIKTEAIHGDKSQNNRQSALANFKAKKTRVLVATDIAARGIDVDDLRYVINYQLPNVPETYVHRIGRTGRAGGAGIAISLCDWSEKIYLSEIQKLIKKTIPVIAGHPYDITAMHSRTETTNGAAAANVSNYGRRKKPGRAFSQA